MKISFTRAKHPHKKTIFTWLAAPHVQEFWDSTDGHKEDLLNFMDGRKTPSDYADGKYVYWIAQADGHPYALIMTIKEDPGEDRPEIKEQYISKNGNTYSIDYMIGDPEYVGKGLGSKTLKEFMDFFMTSVDPKTDTFFIDPDAENARARHVYENVGFIYKGDFIMDGMSQHAGRLTHFLVRKTNG